MKISLPFEFEVFSLFVARILIFVLVFGSSLFLFLVLRYPQSLNFLSF